MVQCDHSLTGRIVSSWILRRGALIRTDVSEECIASIIRETRIGEPGRTLTVTSNRRALEEALSLETSVLTTATLRNIPEDGILHNHRRENLKSYIALTGWTL
jgi:hypothetical protein